ncbi:MAG: ATP-binding cassette domain-containing protein [Planctomycetota bacterium]
MVVVLFGRGRRLGDPLTAEELAGKKLDRLLAVVSMDCECEYDVAPLIGPMIPHRWSQRAQRRAAEKLGFVFQAFHLLPYLTAAENLVLAVRGGDRRQRVREMLQAVGLEDRADAKPGALSQGEQQRVAIARASINQPPVLYADEPTGNLDAHSAEFVHRLLREACDRRAAVVVVSHRPETAAIADRVWRLEDGVLSGAGEGVSR